MTSGRNGSNTSLSSFVVVQSAVKWPYRLMARTSPSHGGNPGSNPGRVTGHQNTTPPSGGVVFVAMLLRKRSRHRERACQGMPTGGTP